MEVHTHEGILRTMMISGLHLRAGIGYRKEQTQFGNMGAEQRGQYVTMVLALKILRYTTELMIKHLLHFYYIQVYFPVSSVFHTYFLEGFKYYFMGNN